MAGQVVWSPEAIEDVESIAEYISRDSETYARAVAGKITTLAKSLREFPLMGRIVPELQNENIRERFAHSYRIIYRIEKKRILVIAILHGKRLLESIGDRFERM